MPDAQLLGTTSDFFGLQRIMRARAESLHLSREKLEVITGLPDGFCNKLLADPPAKNMGITSLGKLLKGLALKLQVVEDAEQLQRIGPLVLRYESNVRTAPLLDPVAAYKIWFARRGGRARWRSTTPEERSAIARARHLRHAFTNNDTVSAVRLGLVEGHIGASTHRSVTVINCCSC